MEAGLNSRKVHGDESWLEFAQGTRGGASGSNSRKLQGVEAGLNSSNVQGGGGGQLARIRARYKGRAAGLNSRNVQGEGSWLEFAQGTRGGKLAWTRAAYIVIQ
jgi:hypothetical protein